MKKSIYLLAITVVTVICVIWGTTTHMGGHFGFFRLDNEEAADYANDYKLDAFDSIFVDADVMELDIKQGAEFALQYDCTEDLIPEYSVENKKLTIKQKQKKNYLVGTHRCSVIVTVPSGTSLKSLDISSDVGDVTIDGIIVDICNGETNVGDFTIQNADMSELYWESDTGNIEVENCSFTKLDLTADVGDVEIESNKKLDDYGFDLKTDVGEVKVNGEEYGRKCIMHGDAGSITVKSDVGDVKVED